MADPADPAQDPQAVGNAFVQQYYSILHKSPELVHKFYQDLSVLSRPGPDGVMTTVTTMKTINDTILSLDYQNYKAEIYSADAQDSYQSGVIVLVTGCLTGEDDLIRKFTQTFFLAPQDRGYYVLNDVFRYLDGKESAGMAINDVDESAPTVTLSDHAATLEKDSNNGKEVSRSLDNGKVPVVSIADQPMVPVVSIADQPVVPAAEVSSNGKVPVLSTGKEVPVVSAAREVPVVSAADHPVVSSQNAPTAETVSSKVQEDAPKKSYASIVHALKGNSAPFRVPPPKPVEQPRAAAAAPPPPPQASAPSSNNVLERNNDRIVKDHSIFVANLPMNATVELLMEIFNQFGPIKPDGVQVRSQKGQGMHGKLNCYGFVEFESASSVQRALEVSNILMIGNRRVSIEVKKGSSDGGRFSAGRGGYRNDNFRSRENFNGGRNYGRNEFEKRGEGQARRNGEGNQKVYQNGGGRAARQGQGQGGQGGRKLAAA